MPSARNKIFLFLAGVNGRYRYFLLALLGGLGNVDKAVDFR